MADEYSECIGMLIEFLKYQPGLLKFKEYYKQIKSNNRELGDVNHINGVQLTEITMKTESHPDIDFYYLVEGESEDKRRTLLEHLEATYECQSILADTDPEEIDQDTELYYRYQNRISILYALCVDDRVDFLFSNYTKINDILGIPPCNFELMKRLADIKQIFQQVRASLVPEHDFLSMWCEIIEEVYTEGAQ